MIHYFSLVRIINSSEVCFYTFALTRFPPLSSHSVGDGLHGAEYGRGDVSGDSEFYIKNQGKIATACSLSLIT